MSTESNAVPTSSAPPSNGSANDPPRRLLSWRFDRVARTSTVHLSPFPLPTPIVVVLASLAVLGMVGWVIWTTKESGTPETPLFGGHRFSVAERVQVEALLSTKAIPTAIDPDGVVRVPLKQRLQAQELLQAQKLAPRSLEDTRRRLAQGGSIFELPEDRARRLHEAREEEARLLLEECPGILSTYVRFHLERPRGLGSSGSEPVSGFVRVEMEPDLILDPATAETILAILRGLVPGLRELVLLDARTLARFEWSHDSDAPPQAIAARSDRLKPLPAQASPSLAQTHSDESQTSLANADTQTNSEVRDLQTRLARRLGWLPHAVVRVEIDPQSVGAPHSPDGDPKVAPSAASASSPSPTLTLNTPIRLPFANPDEAAGSGHSTASGPRYDVVVVVSPDAKTGGSSPGAPPDARQRLDAEVRRIVAEEIPDDRRGAVRVEIEPTPSSPSTSSSPPPSSSSSSRSSTVSGSRSPLSPPSNAYPSRASSWLDHLERYAQAWPEAIAAALGLAAAALGLILGWRWGRSRLRGTAGHHPNAPAPSQTELPPWERVRRIVRDHPEVAAGVLSRWLKSGVAHRPPDSTREFDLEPITVGVAASGPSGFPRFGSRE